VEKQDKDQPLVIMKSKQFYEFVEKTTDSFHIFYRILSYCSEQAQAFDLFLRALAEMKQL